jgi:hypothetical protein
MKFKEVTCIVLAFIAILIWNGLLIKRDQQLLQTYDKICSEISDHPHCRYAK